MKTSSNASTLTLDEKVGQLFFIGIEGPSIDGKTAELVREIKPGGICLFARNIKDPQQTRALLDGLRNLTSVSIFLSVDQEGGLVDRLRRIMTPAPAAARFQRKEEVVEFAEITAESLKILGFNMDFAPVVDVITTEREDAGNGLYSRGFGSSADKVVELAGAFLSTLQKNGIVGCLKHFPGLGAARADSHEELPSIKVTDDELRTTDLYPYRKLLRENTQLVMIAHAAYPDCDLQQKDQNGRLLPSSLNSAVVTQLLRNEMEFRGIAITDDLEMGAIVRSYGIGEACKMALKAGNDILAICAKKEFVEQGRQAVLEAIDSGEINIESVDCSVDRILSLKRKLEDPPEFDIDRLDELTEQLANLNSRLN